jgi:subtilisin family serine protease
MKHRMIRKLMFLFYLVSILALGLPSTYAQESVTEIGSAPPGQDALELIGQIDQSGFDLTAYGYVTFANGIQPEMLFSQGTIAMMRTEGTARLTFLGTGTGTSRAIHQNIFSSVLTAQVTFYWNDTPAAASYDNPESFGSGIPIATLTMRLHSVLNVQEPNVGVFMSFGDAVQDGAEIFTIDGASYRLGHSGLTERFTFFGQGFRSSTEPLLAQYLLAANAVITSETLQQ